MNYTFYDYGYFTEYSPETPILENIIYIKNEKNVDWYSFVEKNKNKKNVLWCMVSPGKIIKAIEKDITLLWPINYKIYKITNYGGDDYREYFIGRKIINKNTSIETTESIFGLSKKQFSLELLDRTLITDEEAISIVNNNSLPKIVEESLTKLQDINMTTLKIDFADTFIAKDSIYFTSLFSNLNYSKNQIDEFFISAAKR